MMRIALLLLAAAASCYAQVSARVSLSNGVQLTIATRSDNATPVTLKTSLEPASGDSFYRIFRDENNLAVFAYELEVARTADGRELSRNSQTGHGSLRGPLPQCRWRQADTHAFRVPGIACTQFGRRVHHPHTQQSRIGAEPDRYESRSCWANGEARTTARRAQRKIRFSGLKVSIHGQPASPSGAGADVAGQYAMFYIPGRGGYFFSTEPVDQPPFSDVGVVDGKHLTFTIDNENYDCTANAPILVHADRGQLWAYHDANYKPAGNWTKTDPASSREEFFTAASDSMQWWLQ